MHKTLLTGFAATLFAAAMSFGGHAAAADEPTAPCTDENQGITVRVVYWLRDTGYWAKLYECNAGMWWWVGDCDRNGCIYY